MSKKNIPWNKVKKTSIINTKNELGMTPPTRTKQSYNPDADYLKYSGLDLNEVQSDYDREKDDNAFLKELVYHYETQGRNHIAKKKERILKNFRIANGLLNKSDFFSEEYVKEMEKELSLKEDEQSEFELEPFPIIQNIVSVLVSHLDKIKNSYTIYAVNPEATSELLEKRTEDLQNVLVSRLQAIYEQSLQEGGLNPEEQPDLYQEQMQLFQELPKVQEYYTKEFRFEIEKWAERKLQLVKQQHKVESLEKELLRNKAVCDEPYIHLSLHNNTVTPEVIRPEHFFYERSPQNDDVCYSTMVGWFTYESYTDVINKYANISEDLANRLISAISSAQPSMMDKDKYAIDFKSELVNAHNYHAFRNMEGRALVNGKEGEYNQNLIEVMHMYMQVPRKINILHMASNGEISKVIVDDAHKITFKPTFMEGKPHKPEYLLDGEFLEPMFINTCYRVVKLNINRSASTPAYNGNVDNEELWVVLEKQKVQISDAKVSNFGSIIPVFGGPQSNKYTEVHALVDRLKPWEVFHTYLWNRNKQILETELGVFLLMNQAAVPNDSMGETWGKNNIMKWALVARDMGIGVMDTSPSNTGGANLSASSGFGQKVDMTRIEEVLQKVKLAEICKRECLAAVGLPPQLLDEITPIHNQDSIHANLKSSAVQLYDFYSQHFSMMERMYQAYLEFEKYIALAEPSAETFLINSDSERTAISFLTKDFPLYRLGLFATSDFKDSLLLQDIKDLVIRDNTMGATLQDKVMALASDSLPAMHEKLKDIQLRQEKEVKKRQEHEMQMQQQQIEASQAAQAAELQAEERNMLRKMQHELQLRELTTIGQINFGEGTTNGVQDIIALNKAQMDRDQRLQTTISNNNKLVADREIAARQSDTQNIKLDIERNKADNQLEIEKEKLSLQRAKILADLKKKEMDMKIAVVNK